MKKKKKRKNLINERLIKYAALLPLPSHFHLLPNTIPSHRRLELPTWSPPPNTTHDCVPPAVSHRKVVVFTSLFGASSPQKGALVELGWRVCLLLVDLAERGGLLVWRCDGGQLQSLGSWFVFIVLLRRRRRKVLFEIEVCWEFSCLRCRFRKREL